VQELRRGNLGGCVCDDLKLLSSFPVFNHRDRIALTAFGSYSHLRLNIALWSGS
jgi:hypothetical protein